VSLPISKERWEALCFQIEKRLHKMAEFYIGRTNSLTRRRDSHDWRGTGVRGFDAMIRLDTFRSREICAGVEAALVREFRGYLRRVNDAEDSRGGWGSGPQHLYLMWREKAR